MLIKSKGVIGMKAIHLQTKSEREKWLWQFQKLFIEHRRKGKEDAEKVR